MSVATRSYVADLFPAIPEKAIDERRVTLELSINSTHAWTTQTLLRRALGDEARIVTVAVNYRRNRSCFQISARHGAMACVMGAIVAALPEAELGMVRSIH